MGKSEQQPGDFESVKTRLAEIADAVSDENLPLDDALDLYEEAVALGLKASDLLETGIVIADDPAEGGAEGEALPNAAAPAGEGAAQAASTNQPAS